MSFLYRINYKFKIKIMDTEITYKYKDGLHSDVKEGYLTLDKSFYKVYTNAYLTNHDDSLDILSRRLWNCHLRSVGDLESKNFLTDIYNYCIKEDEEFEKVYQFLMKQEMVEVIFQMY